MATHRPAEPLESIWTNWSPTKIIVFVTCPLQFYFDYVLRLGRPTDLPRLLGTGLHRMAQSFFTKNYRSMETFIGAWKYMWWVRLPEEFCLDFKEWPDRDKPGKCFGRGAQILKAFWQANLLFRQTAGLKPITEKTIIWQIGPTRMKAVLDRLQPQPGSDNRFTIIDYKTGLSLNGEPELARDLALTIYQMAHRRDYGSDPLGLEIHHLSYLFGDMPEETQVRFSPVTNECGQTWPWVVDKTPVRTEKDITVALVILDQAREFVKTALTGSSTEKSAGGFVPQPGRHCNHCDFEQQCRNWDPACPRKPENYWQALLKQNAERGQRVPHRKTKKGPDTMTPDLFS